FRVDGNRVLEVEEHLVGGQALGLLDHLDAAAGHRKARSARPIRSPQNFIHAFTPTLAVMTAVNRVYSARLAGMVVLGPDGESIGRVRDVVVSISIVRQQPRVLGLVVELLSRRRIFVPIGRVTAIEPNAVTLTTANVSLRRFAQRPGEVLVLGQVIETRVRVDDPELEQLAGIELIVVDLGIEQTRTRDWMVTKVA